MQIGDLERVASRVGKPEEVLSNAFKKEVIAKIVELEVGVEKMRKKYRVTLKEFEKQGLLDKLGHRWEVEEDYYEWDRISTELTNYKRILNSLV